MVDFNLESVIERNKEKLTTMSGRRSQDEYDTNRVKNFYKILSGRAFPFLNRKNVTEEDLRKRITSADLDITGAEVDRIVGTIIGEARNNVLWYRDSEKIYSVRYVNESGTPSYDLTLV